MNTQSNIESRVMANVGVIYSTRKVLGPTAIKAYILVLSAFALWKLVWVTKIMQNFATVEKNGVAAVGNYAVTSVLHTHVAVQLTLLVATVAFALLFIDLFRTATPRQQLAY